MLSFGCWATFAAPQSPSTTSVIVGDVRVTAISSKVIRVEPKGPKGFEDRTTFMVVDRDMSEALDITQKAPTSNGTLLSTSAYTVLLKPTTAPTCAEPRGSTDVSTPVRSDQFPNGLTAADRSACCSACKGDPSCIAWVHESSTGEDVANCWPLKDFASLVEGAEAREFGCSTDACAGKAGGPAFVVRDPNGKLLYDSAATAPKTPANLLYWPSPLAQPAYALEDYPRFYTPSWGAAPAPAGSADADTNGYDFTNNVAGDTYVFLLGETLGAWEAARAAFVGLAGPTPLLPDFAFGTWFTWWHGYSEAEAKDDIARWRNGSLPIDVWALDMNWRNTSGGQDHYYNHPNTNLFQNFSEWFAYLKAQKLRTYFNDHPFPVASRNAGGLQTSPEEVAFRSAGLREWMERGLTYWWFDHNWGFSIPPPFVNTSRTSGVWDGLDNAAWGSHVYYTNVAAVDKERDASKDEWYGGRPITLTKFGLPDWRPGMAYDGAAESPAQHRYPCARTATRARDRRRGASPRPPAAWRRRGAGCGGRATASACRRASSRWLTAACTASSRLCTPTAAATTAARPRTCFAGAPAWTAHCVFGSILRFHGSDHRPWTYGAAVEATIKSYLDMRYKLMPSLLAGGQKATADGSPLVARCDLEWPQHAEAASNLQYLWLADTLVAPIYDAKATTRDVWIPPGKWQDAWNGSVVTGPATLAVTQPAERVPMWHRAEGGLVLAIEEPAERVDDQDWSHITLHAFPNLGAPQAVHRTLYERRTGARTRLSMATVGDGASVRIEVGAAEDGAARGWRLRLQLPREVRAASLGVAATVDGEAAAPTIIAPSASALATPFGGAGMRPAAGGGSLVELFLPSGEQPRVIELRVGAAAVVEAAA